MRTFNRSAIQLGLTALFSLSALAISGTASATAFDGGIPATWDCTGDCGTLGANGDITASPEGGDYGYIVSDTGITGLGLGIPGETDGTRLRTGAFSAGAGDALDFYFNFVSPDGTSSFPDYAWVRLLDASLSEVAILFTARTTTSGDTVPGFGLPWPGSRCHPESRLHPHHRRRPHVVTPGRLLRRLLWCQAAATRAGSRWTTSSPVLATMSWSSVCRTSVTRSGMWAWPSTASPSPACLSMTTRFPNLPPWP